MDMPQEECKPVTRKRCHQKPMQVQVSSKPYFDFTKKLRFVPLFLKECRMVDVPDCSQKETVADKQCTTKYVMDCNKLPGYQGPPNYGYVKNNCNYKPVQECKSVVKRVSITLKKTKRQKFREIVFTLLKRKQCLFFRTLQRKIVS